MVYTTTLWWPDLTTVLVISYPLCN